MAENDSTIGDDSVNFVIAFQEIENLSNRLLEEVPQEFSDLIFAIRTIAKFYGDEMKGKSEFFTCVPEGGAA